MSRRSASAASPASSAATPRKLGPAHPLEPFSLAFLDPPYGKGLAEKALASARDGGWLTPGALVVVEEAADAGFAAPEGFEELERREYDDTELVFLRAPPNCRHPRRRVTQYPRRRVDSQRWATGSPRLRRA